MKLIGIVFLGVLGAASTAYGQRGRDNTEPVDRACSVTECFLEAQVRDFEVIDRTQVIVYVGSQRCAFHVEVRGTFCDLTFAPELYFSKTNEVPQSVVPQTPGTGAFDPFEIERRERRDLRICANDLTVQVHGGAFTETTSAGQGTDRFGNPRTDCRVSSVRAITDDQLVELYVAQGVVPPLPPMGAGEIEIGEQEAPASPDEPVSPVDSAAPADSN